MSAQHYKAAYWVAEGVFNSLASFGEFEARVNDIVEEKDRGDGGFRREAQRDQANLI